MPACVSGVDAVVTQAPNKEKKHNNTKTDRSGLYIYFQRRCRKLRATKYPVLILFYERIGNTWHQRRLEIPRSPRRTGNKRHCFFVEL